MKLLANIFENLWIIFKFGEFVDYWIEFLSATSQFHGPDEKHAISSNGIFTKTKSCLKFNFLSLLAILL